MNPLTHLNTNSALFVHHATVISYIKISELKYYQKKHVPIPKARNTLNSLTSVISCISKTGIVKVVMSFEQAVFNIFLKPKMAECLEFISPNMKQIRI